MNSTNPLRNYKHDIAGKFKDINTALAAMNENSFENPENNEIFHAIHEVLLKMVKTSRNTMRENLKQDMLLVVSDKDPILDLPKLQIEGVIVRYESTAAQVTYSLHLSENEGDMVFNLGRIHPSLPIHKINFDLKDKELEASLRKIEALSL